MPSCILVLTLLVIQHSTSLHLAQILIYNEQAYLNSLQDVHSKFRADIDKIKADLLAFRRELAKTQGNDTARLKLLKNALSVERGDLIRLEGYVKLPYGQKACRCKGFAADLKSIATTDVQMVSNSIQKLKNDMLQWPNCRVVKQLKLQTSRQEQYITTIKEIASSDCHRPPKSFQPDEPTGLINLNQSRYISNLEGAKWIYGSIAPSDYKYRMFSLSSKVNLTRCPEQRPFTRDGRKCMGCPQNNPIWNVGDSMCTTCSVGQHYNPHGHNCSTGSLKEEEQIARAKGIGVYGAERMQPASGFNRNRHGTNFINSPPEHDPDLSTCPINQPFFNGKACIACNLPLVFNFDTLTCESCPSGTTYNIKRKKCSSESIKRLVTNLKARNLVVGVDKTLTQYQDEQQQQLSQNPDLSICPISKPYFDGQECVSCPGTQPYFNLASQQCERCDPGFSYFQSANNCTVNMYITNSLAKGLIQSDKATIASIYEKADFLKSNNPLNRLELCPLNRPFAKNFTCIKCPEQNPLFNLETQNCIRCPEQTTYDPSSSRCIGHFITNPQAPNLYFKGTTRKQYTQYYQQMRDRYPNIRDCPSQAPYFDGRRCVSCALSTPIFSLRTKMCGQCPVEQEFHPESGDCLSE